jgi:hypothetical protein
MGDTSGLRRTLAWTVVGSLTACAVIAAVAVVLGEFGKALGQAALISLALAGFSVTTLGSTAGTDRPWSAALSLSGAAASALGMVAALVAILQFEDVTWATGRVLLVLIVAAVTVPYCAFLLLGYERGAVVNGVVVGAVGLVVTFGTLLVTVILTDGDLPDGLYRLMGVVAIFMVLGTVVVPILTRTVPRSRL